jgi:hypothetical protein
MNDERRLADVPEFEFELWEADADLSFAERIAPAAFRAELHDIRERLSAMRQEYAAAYELERRAS